MRVEFEGGPADGVREEVPDGITTIFLTDIGPASEGPDPFEDKPLGTLSYEMTDRKTTDGITIFKYVDADSGRTAQS